MGDFLTKNKIKDLHLLRKLISLGVFFLAIFYFLLPKDTFLIYLSTLTIFFVLSDLTYHFSNGKNKYSQLFYKLYPKKEDEYKQLLSDASIFLLGCTILVILFNKNIAIISLIAFIFSDMGEHTVGVLFHKGKLFWDANKTWPAFLVGILISFICITLTSHYISFNLSFSAIVFASIASGIAGTADKMDNVLIPFSIAIVLSLIAYI